MRDHSVYTLTCECGRDMEVRVLPEVRCPHCDRILELHWREVDPPRPAVAAAMAAGGVNV